MMEALHNYHSHTTRCLHAQDSEEEYILSALDAGFATIGFSDHMPWYTCPDPPGRVRMLPEEMGEYVATVRALGRKYAGRIRVLVALECEAMPDYFGNIAELKEKYALDYLILGSHSADCSGDYFGTCVTPAELKAYRDVTIAGMRTGLFAYLAHPDLCLQRYPAFDDAARGVCRDICAAAKDLDLPLEYNLLGESRRPRAIERGGLGYTTDAFWEIAAQTGNRAIIGVDAHNRNQMNCRDRFLTARAKLRALGLKVIDHPDGLAPGK